MLRRETALPSAKEKKVVDVFLLYALAIGHCLIKINCREDFLPMLSLLKPVITQGYVFLTFNLAMSNFGSAGSQFSCPPP